MPEISRFFGIVISMFWNEHEPPHFHARYSNFSGVIEIESLKLIKGDLPPRVLGLIIEWAVQHKSELLSNWEIARERKPLSKIEPLQ